VVRSLKLSGTLR